MNRCPSRAKAGCDFVVSSYHSPLKCCELSTAVASLSSSNPSRSMGRSSNAQRRQRRNDTAIISSEILMAKAVCLAVATVNRCHRMWRQGQLPRRLFREVSHCSGAFSKCTLNLIGFQYQLNVCYFGGLRI